MRTLPILCLASLAPLGCVVAEIDAIIAKYDTFGSTDTSTGDTSTGTSGTDTGTQTDSAGTQAGTTHGEETGGVEGTAGTDTGTTQGDTGESSTGTTAVCGDGIINGDEECDDANASDGDGCLGNCTREWLVFVTSDPATQGNLGGLVGADYECRHRATKLFLPNGERYKAWISTSTVQPVDRLYHARGPYKLINGLQVAADWDALVSGKLDNPINVTELSETSAGLVFTGTLPTGERAPDSTHCDDWTTGAGDKFAWFGASTESDSNWTHAVKVDCGAGANLICFEQP